MGEEIQARLILEVLGRPPEHILEALRLLVEKISNEQGVKLIEKEIHEPILAKDAKDLYTAFVDVTLAFDNLEVFFNILFAYMPSNVEMIYPEKLNLNNESISLIANKLLQRLHNYDAIAKGVLAERNVIAQKLREKAPDVLKELNYYFEPPSQKNEKQAPKKQTKKQKAKKKK